MSLVVNEEKLSAGLVDRAAAWLEAHTPASMLADGLRRLLSENRIRFRIRVRRPLSFEGEVWLEPRENPPPEQNCE